MSDYELQARLIYALIVAGKSAKFATAATKKLLTECRESELPWAMVRRLIRTTGIIRGNFKDILRKHRTGNYQKLFFALVELATSGVGRNLRTCTPQELETVHGIGPKTSRFFINWTRPDAQYAVLDVHVLRWLKENCTDLSLLVHDVPKTTPQSRSKYQLWENIFCNEAMLRGKTPQQLDAEIWTAGSRYSQAELFEELCTTKTKHQTSVIESTAG